MKKTWATRALAMLTFTITFLAALCGCSSTSVNGTTKTSPAPQFSENGYIIGPGGLTCTVQDPYMTFSYTILNENEYDKAEFDRKTQDYIDIVRKWWNDDETFVTPNGIIPVVFGNGPRGLAQDGYIFIEPFREDSYITVVHETIHLQNEKGLRDSADNGKSITEMIVEDITLRLLGKDFFGLPTDEQRFFKSCPNLVMHRETLESAYKNKESAEQVYTRIFGKDWKTVTGTLNSWGNLPSMMDATSLDFFTNRYLGIAPSQLDGVYQKILKENKENQEYSTHAAG